MTKEYDVVLSREETRELPEVRVRVEAENPGKASKEALERVSFIKNVRLAVKSVAETTDRFPGLDPEIVDGIEKAGQLRVLRSDHHKFSVISRTNDDEYAVQGFATMEEAKKDLEETYFESLEAGYHPYLLYNRYKKTVYDIKRGVMVKFEEREGIPRMLSYNPQHPQRRK